MEQQMNEENIPQNNDPGERSPIQKVIATLKSKKLKESVPIRELISNQQPIVQQFELNHGLFLDGCKIEPSKQAVLNEDGELNISLYEGQPFVYTSINNRNSHVNLLSFNSDDNDVELDESLRPSNICINFPIIEITYTVDLSKSFSRFMNDDEGKLYEMYGHLFPIKILIGGKLFIDGLESVNSTQIDIFNSYLTWAYDSAKHRKEIPSNNLFTSKFFPKITTTDGIDLDTYEKLTDWMNNLYQDDTVEIISYNNLVPISKDTKSFVDEILPGVANFKERLTLENWVGDSLHINIIRWVKEFQLFQGLIIDQDFELKVCKEKAIDLINFPNANPNDKFYLEIVKPTTILEGNLINNNIFPTNNNEDISTFPFIKVSDDLIYEDYVYFLVKCEKYKISLNINDIKPSEKFNEDIEKALESMKPLIDLQKVFNKYGHFIPLNILLGKSLRNTIATPSNISERIYLVSPVFKSLKSHLTDYNIHCLITQKEDIIEENDLSEWIQNTKNDLEVIELNNIIPLYKILEVKQTKRIDTVLNKQDKFKIIMTGSVDLKDSDITKQIIISIEPSLENKNYEVFGSIVSKNNSKLDDIFVTFESYETNQFSATIKTSKNTNISIEESYIIWMIIGNPSELSVFCPKNREIQAEYFKKAITLQRKNSSYSIKTSHQLSQGYDISIKFFEPINIELTGWSKNCVYLNILNSSIDFNSDRSNVEVAICTLSHSDYENANINGKKYSMGYILNENNYRGEPRLEQTNTRKYIDKRYPIKGDRKKLNELIMTNENLGGHLDLTDFTNLEKLQCFKNKLTSLDISKNEKLTEIDCSQNNLVSLDLSSCLNIKSVTANCNQLNELKLPVIASNDNLEYLNLLDNSFSQKLNCFGRLINLKDLHIGNTDEYRIEQGIYNHFYGSLKPLKSLIKLENLSINDTDIDSGLEYLPNSIKIFRCSANKRPEAKVIRINEQLNAYTMSFNDAFQGRYNLKAWKKNWKLIKENETLQNQIKQIEKLTLDAKLTELENEKNILLAKEKELINKNKLLKCEIDDLGTKLMKLKDEKKILHAKEEELIKKNKQLEYNIDDLRQEIKDLNADIKQQKERIEEREKKLELLIAEKTMKREELQKEIIALKDDLAIKEKDIKQSENQLEETKKEYANINNELDKIRSSLSEIENKKAELECLKKQLEHEKHFSKTGTSELRKKIGDLKKYLVSSQSKKGELEAKAKEIEALQTEQISHKKLKEEKENLKNKLKIQENNLKVMDETISNLKQQNEEKTAALMREIERCKKEISMLYQQIELSELVNNVSKNHDLGRKGMHLVDNILEKQRNTILTNDNSDTEELEKIRRKLIDLYDLTEEKIQKILDKQSEITKSKLEIPLIP